MNCHGIVIRLKIKKIVSARKSQWHTETGALFLRSLTRKMGFCRTWKEDERKRECRKHSKLWCADSHWNIKNPFFFPSQIWIQTTLKCFCCPHLQLKPHGKKQIMKRFYRIGAQKTGSAQRSGWGRTEPGIDTMLKVGQKEHNRYVYMHTNILVFACSNNIIFHG